ncbi:uncharacterized protein LOC108904765 [Anoplophora glabripennis]|uniref:uncharacterized protein LOC108904765 n=1 Tax=Anoplophora glabripennis TaxID=217634 RepID=UPI0008735C97|nr:uncharacterized protein LOC108904765 [Anoplophora glabripennis]
MCSKVILDEKLIECVRMHEVLYNTDRKEYSDNYFKLKIWSQIAKNCGMASGEEAKKYWKSLRDGYRSALKLYTSGKTDPSKKIRTWKYFEQMNFLRPYMRNRQRKDNANSEHSEDIDTLDENSQENRPSDIIKEEDLEYFEAPDSIDAGNEGCFQSDSPVPPKKMCLTAKSRNDQSDGTPTGIHWTQTEFCPVPEDSLKLFFDAMYASTKKLPPALQRAVKSKLFQAVAEAEIEMEQTGNTY